MKLMFEVVIGTVVIREGLVQIMPILMRLALVRLILLGLVRLTVSLTVLTRLSFRRLGSIRLELIHVKFQRARPILVMLTL